MPSTQYTSINTALETLQSGGLLGLPTETVYGLAANALDDTAIAKIYALKKRPQFNPLIAHFASIAQAKQYVHFNAEAEQLTKAFWPGPLTLILPKKENCKISLLASAGLETLAVRIPAHPLAQEILNGLDFPLVAPSANPSESISPTTADHVRSAFSDLCVVDGGPCTVGLESTIVDLTQKAPVILRPGSLTPQEVESALETKLLPNTSTHITSPGQLKRHYAPSIPLRLNVTALKENEALLSFGEHTLTNATVERNLSPSADLQEAASNLFKFLRELDITRYSSIAVTKIPNIGIGIAINDRLKRASS